MQPSSPPTGGPDIESNVSLLAHFFHAAPSMMGVVEVKDGKVQPLFENPAMKKRLEALRVSNREPEGVRPYLPPEVYDLWINNYAEAKRLGQPVHFSQRIETHGRVVWVQATAMYLGASAEGNDLCSYIVEDITEKKLLLDELKAEKERFQLAVEGANAGLWDWDVSSNEVHFSRQWQEMLGYGPREVEQTIDGWLRLLHPDDKETALKRVSDYFTGVSETYTLEHRLRCKDGSYRWVLSKGMCTRDDAGRPVRMTGWHVDIHELRSTVEELKQRDAVIRDQQVKIIASAKMSSLGEMAGSIAHEINNPLAIIALSATQISDSIRHAPVDMAAIREGLQKIESTVKRIGKIVKGLRAFSRSGENDPFEMTPLEQIVNDTLELCREHLRSHDIELRVGTLPSCTLQCRGVQICQVLLNLLHNALDAVKFKPNAWIELIVVPEGNHVRFTVSDSGDPIPENIAVRMMEPFFTTKDVGEGTGLGLSIAKGIVEDHGGRLEYQRRKAGTSFSFSLPLRHQP